MDCLFCKISANEIPATVVFENERVVAFDISAPPEPFTQPQVETVRGDITDADAVKKAAEGVECIFHIAALVGPYHEEHKYEAVNYGGSVNVIEACRAHGIHKLVMSSSPSSPSVEHLEAACNRW